MIKIQHAIPKDHLALLTADGGVACTSRRFGGRMPRPLSHQILTELVDIPCPSCSYVFEAQLVDALTQVFRLCPCCHVRIHLVDDGSLFGALKEIDQSVEELRRMFR